MIYLSDMNTLLFAVPLAVVVFFAALTLYWEMR